MTYLVTGATGFIGTRLVTRLLARGDAVIYLARKRNERLPSQAAFHPWDTSKRPDLDALPRIDAIFHLAGEPIAQRWSREVKKRIRDSRVEGTKNLVAALRNVRHPPAVLVSASAVGYYGESGDRILTESAPAGEDFLAVICKEWEAEAERAREFGLRVVPIRIATVIGKGGGALEAMLPAFRLGAGAKFGDGRQWMSWIDVDDLARLFLFAADTASLQGPLNGSSPLPVTNAEFTRTLGKVLRRPAILAVPKFALRLLLGEMSEFLFTSLRVVPQAAEQAGFQFERPEIGTALRAAV